VGDLIAISVSHRPLLMAPALTYVCASPDALGGSLLALLVAVLSMLSLAVLSTSR
jgi:hypothetical protein